MPRMSVDEAKPAIVLRDILDLAEMRQVEELQKEVWGVDDREVFPALALRPLTLVGGVLIGAFDGDRMVGFVFGFLGLENGQAILHSDMLAVKAEYRSRGIGYRLKLAQRDSALEKGIDKITWTFDPLQPANAHLNFARLGVTADRYLINFYGETTSHLHRAGTDRLWLTWLLNSDRVKQKLRGRDTRETSASDLDQSTVLVNVAEGEEPLGLPDGPLEGSAIIEIPDNMNNLLEDNVELAIRWRGATRHGFKKALDAGYRVEEFYRIQRDGRSIGRYLLVS